MAPEYRSLETDWLQESDDKLDTGFSPVRWVLHVPVLEHQLI